MESRELLYIFSIFIIVLLSLAMCRYLIILTIPLSILFRDCIIRLICRIEDFRIGQVCEIHDDYVYVKKCNRIIVAYRVESLLNLERLRPKTYVSICRDLIKRMLISDDVAVGFLVKKDSKYVIINVPKVRNLNTYLSNFENVLSEYFMYSKVTGDILRKLFSSSKVKLRKSLYVIVPIILFSILFLKSMSLPVIIFITIFIIYLYRNYRVYNMFNSLRYTVSRNRVLFIQRSPDNIKSDALQVSRFRGDYIIIFRKCRDLEIIAREKLHKYQESLVVKERGSSYSEVLAWRNVIDRLNFGEEPLYISIHASSLDILSTYFNFTIGSVDDIFDISRIDTYALSDDISILIPLHSSSISVLDSTQRIFIGIDRSSREVYLDLNSLPNYHILIIGPTGMGKSWTAKSLICRFYRCGISVVIVDPHGEYLTFLKSKGINDIIEIDFPHKFVNIFELYRLNIPDKVYRICTALRESLNIEILDDIVDLIEKAYRRNIHRDVKSFVRLLHIASSDVYLKMFMLRLLEYFENCKILNLNELLSRYRVVIFNFKNILHDLETLMFLMSLLIDLLYTHMVSKYHSSYLRSVIVIDEAYYIFNSKILELCIRGLRKFGIGLVLICQSLSNVKYDILQNIGTSIILGGSDPYVESIASIYMIDEDDITWLSTSVQPTGYRRSIKALLMVGPIKKHVYVNLE